MQYQPTLNKVDGFYSLYRIKAITGGKRYCCLICGVTIQKKQVVYYKSSDLQLCSACAEQARRPDKYRIIKI